MTYPRIDVILKNLRIHCVFYQAGSCGTWCKRAYGNKENNDQPKYVKCYGWISKCELTEEDRINETGKFATFLE